MTPEQWRVCCLFMRAMLFAVIRGREACQLHVDEALKALEWHLK